MMTFIISSALKILVLFSLSILIYGLFLFFSAKRSTDKLPYIFSSMYTALSNMAPVKNILDYMQKSFYLIYVNRRKSEVLAAICVTSLPSVCVLMFTFVNIFSPVWYLSVVLFFLSIIAPFYLLRSYVTKKCIIIRVNLLHSLSSISSLLSTSTVEIAFEDMLLSTFGPVHEIYKEFLTLYRSNRRDAYNFLRKVSGDTYTLGIADSIEKFDTEGTDVSMEINKMCKQGLDIFNLRLMGYRNFSDLKFASVVVFFGCIALRFFGRYIGEMMNFQYNETVGFICILGGFTAFVFCFAFESTI